MAPADRCPTLLALAAAAAAPAAQGFRAGAERPVSGGGFEQINEVLASGASSLRHAFGWHSSGLVARGSSHVALLQRASNYVDVEVDALDFIVFVISFIICVIIYMLLVFLAAKYYLGRRDVAYSNPLEVEANPEGFQAFRAGVFECHQRPDICLWSLCCPWVRWGDNLWTMGLFESFWQPLTIYFVLFFFDVGGRWLILLALIGATYRQELRKKFDMARKGGITFLEDFCLYLWCSCCMVAQEARHIEEAVRADHPAVVIRAGAAGAPAEP